MVKLGGRKMSELDAFGKKELLKILKERMEEFKDGVILKVKKEKLDIDTPLSRSGMLSVKDLKLLDGGIFDFSRGTKVKSLKGNKWLLITPNQKFPCLVKDEIMKVYYRKDIKSLKKLSETEIRTILKVDVIRHDDVFIYNGRDGYSVDIDPSQKAIDRWGSEGKARKKIEDRMRNYRDRTDNWFNKIKEKAKKESKWGGIL